MSARSSTTRRAQAISDYAADMEGKGRLIAKVDAPTDGRFVAPQVFRVSGIGEMQREMFGPVLHVATFEAERLERVIADINRKGYGLTFGLHTRIEARVQHIVDGIHAGNIYVNRNQIGAVVGSQPFGGEGLSGTGPKAGGPHYLRRFRTARAEAGAQCCRRPARSTATALTDTSAATPRLAAGRRGPIASPSCASICAARAPAAIAAAAAIDFGPVDLPGPTGEANTLTLLPRGRALCLGPDADTLLAQAVQALAAGNAVLAVAPGAAAALQPLTGKGLPIAAIDGTVGPGRIARRWRVDVVAFSGEAEPMRVVRQVLAAAHRTDRAAGHRGDLSGCLCA